MKIIYMHHAERNITESTEIPELRQLDDITKRGEDIANILAERFKGLKVTAIITSPYLRCKHTAKIINRYLKAPIIEDERLNEVYGNIEWSDALNRNIAAIDDIIRKYDNDDTIICVTSGVNISAFICYFYNIKPNNNIPYTQAVDISPIMFNYDKTNYKNL